MSQSEYKLATDCLYSGEEVLNWDNGLIGIAKTNTNLYSIGEKLCVIPKYCIYNIGIAPNSYIFDFNLEKILKEAAETLIKKN